MKTPKELKDFYIRLLLETSTEKEYAEELVRLKYIFGARPKPQRTEKEQMFVDFVESNCYKGNYTSTLFFNEKGKMPNEMNEVEVIEMFGSLEEGTKYYSLLGLEAGKRITAAFERNKNELNKILK